MKKGFLTLVLGVFFLGLFTTVYAQDFSCSDVNEIPQIECEALIALYNNTNGEGWTTKTNWLVTDTPSNWYGVTVQSGHVTVVDLSSNELSGIIPLELENLGNLQQLILGFNKLSGSIPSCIGNLSNLNRLILADNQLTGSIPSELGNLTNLTWLILAGNQLSGTIPPQLGNLIKLERLELAVNKLSGSIPPELGNLTNLTWLILSHNYLSGDIPPELENLTKLVLLMLDYNYLTVPDDYPDPENSFYNFLFIRNPSWDTTQMEMLKVFLPLLVR